MSVLGLKAAVDAADFELAQEKLAKIHYEASSFNVTVDEIADMLDDLPRGRDHTDPSPPGTGDPAQLERTGKVTQLRIAALNALTILVMNSNGAALLRERSSVLLTHLISNLDLASEVSNLSSSVWVLWLADRSSAERILREYGIMHPRAPVRLVALNELTRWVHAMEGRIAFRKFTAAVVRQLRDENADIRQAAYTLLVQFFATAKQPARDDLFLVMRKMQLSESLIEKVGQNIARVSQELDAQTFPSAQSVPSPQIPPAASALPVQSPQPVQPPVIPSSHSVPSPQLQSPEPVQSPLFQSAQFQATHFQASQSPQLQSAQFQPTQSPQLQTVQSQPGQSPQFQAAQPLQYPQSAQSQHSQAVHNSQSLQNSYPIQAAHGKPQNLGIRIPPTLRKATPPVSPVPSSTSQLEFMKDPLYPMQPLPEPKQRFNSQEYVLQELQQSTRFFVGKETEHNWFVRHQTIQLLRYMIRMPTESIQLLREAFRIMQRGLSEAVISMRTTLAIDTCQAIKDFVQFMGKKPFFLELFDPLLDSLAKAATNIKKITASAANLTLCAMLYESPTISTRQFTMIVQEAKSMKPQARAYAYGWLTIVMPSQYPHLASRHADIVSIICRAVSDASPLGRSQGRELYWITAEVWPELTQAVDKKVGTSVHRALQASRPSQRDLSVRAPSAPSRISSAGQTSIQSPQLRRPSYTMVATSMQPHSQANSQPPSRPPSQPTNHLTSHPTSQPSSQPSSQIQLPSRPSSRAESGKSQHGESLSQSIADLSMQDMESPIVPQSDTWSVELEDHQRANSNNIGIDYTDEESVRQAVSIDRLVVLRDLARNVDKLEMETVKSVLDYIRNVPGEAINTIELAEMMQRDQTNGLEKEYSRLLRIIEPENSHKDIEAQQELETPEMQTAPKTPYQSGNATPMRSMIYMDSQSSDSSVLSNHSVSSRHSESSISEVSITKSSLTTESTALRTPQPMHAPSSRQLLPQTNISSDVVGPFSTSQAACKTEITHMLEQVKSLTATVETLAALSVLVTASAVVGVNNAGPLHTAVSLWQRHYTYDMELRDTILPLINAECASEQPEVDKLVVALVLLRCLLLSPVSHAPVYLHPIACLTTLLEVGKKIAPQSLEVAEHLLPDLAALVVSNRAMSSTNFMEALATCFPAGHTLQKVLVLRILSQAVANNNAVLEDEGTRVISLLVQAMNDCDVSVRKEAYPAMVTVHNVKPSLGQQAASQMSVGQQKLLSHYLGVL